MRRLTLLCAALGLSLAACGDSTDKQPGEPDGEGDFAQLGAELAGIYEIESFTRNEAGCSKEGADVLASVSQPYLVISQTKAFGVDLVNVVSCTSVADCRVRLEQVQNGKVGAAAELIVNFIEAKDASTLESRAAFTGFQGFGEEEGLCRDAEVTLNLLTAVGRDALELSIEHTPSDNYESDDGFCDTDLAAAAAKGNECATREVVKAELVEEL